MNISMLNKVCFTICIVCIVAGMVMGLSLIWVSASSEIFWKGLATTSVVFLASSATLAVSKAFQSKPTSDSGR